jgi:hypothetical protein
MRPIHWTFKARSSYAYLWCANAQGTLGPLSLGQLCNRNLIPRQDTNILTYNPQYIRSICLVLLDRPLCDCKEELRSTDYVRCRIHACCGLSMRPRMPGRGLERKCTRNPEVPEVLHLRSHQCNVGTDAVREPSSTSRRQTEGYTLWAT